MTKRILVAINVRVIEEDIMWIGCDDEAKRNAINEIKETDKNYERKDETKR